MNPRPRAARGSASLTPSERFWAKVDKSGDCWLWTAALDRHGYGAFRTGGRHRLAHRVAYELVIGPIPEGLDLDHLCRVHDCVNPAHLEPVTRRENLARGVGFIAREIRTTHCPRGHEYSPENTYVATGSRNCRRCTYIRNTERRRSLRERKD